MKHVTFTGSRYAERILASWPSYSGRFVKVMPREYRRALEAEARKRRTGPVVGDVVTPVAASGEADSASVRAAHG
jgi:glutamate synthase (NADPH/NADH) large chain